MEVVENVGSDSETILNGWLRKTNGKRKIGNRYFELKRGGSLYWFLNPSGKYKGKIDLVYYNINSAGKKGDRIHLTPKNKSNDYKDYTLSAPSSTEAMTWLTGLLSESKNAVLNTMKLEDEILARTKTQVQKRGPLCLDGKTKTAVVRDGHLIWFPTPKTRHVEGHFSLIGTSLYVLTDKMLKLVFPSSKECFLDFSNKEELNQWLFVLQAEIENANQSARSIMEMEGGKNSSNGAPQLRGWLRKKGKNRFFVLANGVLMWFSEKQEEKVEVSKMKGSLNVVECYIASTADLTGNENLNELSFSICNSRTSYDLKASSREEMHQWVYQLQQAARAAHLKIHGKLAEPTFDAKSKKPENDETSGWMKIKGKKRWFLLRDSTLMWFSKQIDQNQTPTPADSFSLVGCSVNDVSDLSFVVFLPNREKYILTTETRQSCTLWKSALSIAINAGSRLIFTHALNNKNSEAAGSWLLLRGKKRFFVLSENFLSWYKDFEEGGGALNVQGTISLQGASVSIEGSSSSMISLVAAAGDRYCLTCQSSEEREKWIRDIMKNIIDLEKEQKKYTRLATNYYPKLEKLLLDFPSMALLRMMWYNNDSTELTNLILQWSLYQQQHVTLIKTLIRDELSAAQDDKNTLFRGESKAVMCMRHLHDLIASDYIIDILKPHIDHILRTDPALFEVDTSKMSSSQQSNIEEHRKLLEKTAAEIITDIFYSVEQYPNDFKHVYCELRKSINENPSYPKQSQFTAIGGFFFLRFVCPAIFSPERYHLIKEGNIPSTDQRRTLTLVSKLIIQLANGLEFGSKERFLQPHNLFLDTYQPMFNNFLQELTAVFGSSSFYPITKLEHHDDDDADGGGGAVVVSGSDRSGGSGGAVAEPGELLQRKKIELLSTVVRYLYDNVENIEKAVKALIQKKECTAREGKDAALFSSHLHQLEELRKLIDTLR